MLAWDMEHEPDRSYYEFFLGRFLPRMNTLGFELSEAWATVYGDGPQVQLCALLPDELEAERRMAQPEWQQLLDELEQFVGNVAVKLVPNLNGFQMF